MKYLLRLFAMTVCILAINSVVNKDEDPYETINTQAQPVKNSLTYDDIQHIEQVQYNVNKCIIK